MTVGAEGSASPARGAAFLRPDVSLSRLVVTNFRSYARAELALDGRPVVFVGDNGAGKTNLLEAVSLLSPGRGMRGVPFAEVARDTGDGGWAVAATLETNLGETRIGTGLPAGDNAKARTRLVKIDGEQASSAGVLASLCRVVWLTPAMDRLFVEGASERRRFFDRLVMGFDPAHGTRVNAYDKAMRERNRLLSDDVRDVSWLAALEDQMATHGVAVAAARVEALGRMRAAIEAGHDAHFPRADLGLEGELEADLGAGAAAVDVEDQFKSRLAATRARDAGAGRTLSGPHRSDLTVRHIAKDREARACSTGEQKALLIGIMLANARLLAARGTPPLVLLDEIAAHLDEERRHALFDEILGLKLQAFMTGTEPSLFDGLGGRAQTFRIADGAVGPTDQE
ncbi:MAG: DNA replication/repair protein RecF [Parvibaculum sp.]|nr:DNA replication/repair protein RecF [Parvibaculum sp.]